MMPLDIRQSPVTLPERYVPISSGLVLPLKLCSARTVA